MIRADGLLLLGCGSHRGGADELSDHQLGSPRERCQGALRNVSNVLVLLDYGLDLGRGELQLGSSRDRCLPSLPRRLHGVYY